MKKLFIAALSMGISAAVFAKLPALNDEAKAKAAEAAAKTAWSAKVDAFKLCMSQDKTAAGYYKSASASAKGKSTKTAATTPPCADPGAFVYAPTDAVKPIEASGAHSPATTAASPPSTKQPDAVINSARKP